MKKQGHSCPEKVDVVTPVRKFLEAHGWRGIRHEFGYVPGVKTMGEKGMPDWCFLRYSTSTPSLCAAFVLWIEFKAPGYKPRGNPNCVTCHPDLTEYTKKGKPKKGYECRRCGQTRWADAERARGGTVLTVSDPEPFKAWYNEVFSWLS